MPLLAWEGGQQAEAALVSRGATVALSPSENTFPPWLRTLNADNFLLRNQGPAVPTGTRSQPLWQSPHQDRLPMGPTHLRTALYGFSRLSLQRV